MNRKIILCTIFITSFFLVFLGMRTPNLSAGTAPKQHPRAIIENVTSKPLDANKQAIDDFAGVAPIFSIYPEHRTTIFAAVPVLLALSSPPPALTFARAPPTTSI